MDLDLGYDDPLSFPSQMTDALMCDTNSLVQAFCDEDHFRMFDADYFIPPQSPSFECPSTLLSSILQPPSSSRSVKVGAQKRWRLVFNVLQWFFLLRGVMGRRSRGAQIY